MKLLRTIINIYQKQIVKQQVLNKAVLVKTLFICHDQALDLESSKLSYHISIFIFSVGNQNVFQLIIITDLEILVTFHKLAGSLGFYKCLDILRLNLKITVGGRQCLAICINNAKLRPGYLLEPLKCILQYLIRYHYPSIPSCKIYVCRINQPKRTCRIAAISP